MPLALLAAGCASRSLVFTWTGPDGAAHQVRSRTTAAPSAPGGRAG